ncbi:hypothetical protein MUK42_15217 [Musa troglodytarum]|uniref:Uncharacterized protein n=1 Tax=Musa troglodytarum TaxID=320322 RepID=A0A9E7HCY2_9LILI|nr:hypothetical protein MUK42_15217 [Musa troglodytarum]
MAIAADEFPTLPHASPVSKAVTLSQPAGFSLLIAFSKNPRCVGDADQLRRIKRILVPSDIKNRGWTAS